MWPATSTTCSSCFRLRTAIELSPFSPGEEVWEKSYGPDHPSVATALDNLAGLLGATNRFGEAEPLYRRALTIWEKSYGPDHPDVATCIKLLAGLLHATSRFG